LRSREIEMNAKLRDLSTDRCLKVREKNKKDELEIQTTAPLVARRDFSVNFFSCSQFWEDAIFEVNYRCEAKILKKIFSVTHRVGIRF
jgi:hypothetical protein